MTVSAQTPRNQYTANGATTQFIFTFLIPEASDLAVYVGSVLQALNTDYTVPSGSVDNPAGGTLTFTTAPADGAIVTITRSLPLERTVNYQPNGSFDSPDINSDLDRLWMKQQEVSDTLARAVVLQPFDTQTTLTLPTASERANTYLYFDASGNLSSLTQVGKWRGTWATGTDYILGDVVKDSAAGALTNNLYICILAHHSGTWSIDLSSKWQLAIDVSSVTTSESNAATSASNAASSASAAGTSATNAASSASAASTSESNAANSAANASISAGSAASSAGEASISASDAANSATSAANSAASITFPSAVGQGLNYIRQKSDASGFEYRTPTQVATALSSIVALTDAATITPDFGSSNNFSVTLGGSRTIAAPTNATPGQSGFIAVSQDATGSRTLTWNSVFKWSNGTAGTLTTTAGATDLVSYYVISATAIALNLYTNAS